MVLQDQVEYDDYRNVDGVQMPFRIRISTDAAPSATTIRTVAEVRHNVAVDVALFRPPG